MSATQFHNEHVRLRALEPVDVEALHAYLNDERLFGRRYLPWGIVDAGPFSHGKVHEILAQWAKEKKAFALGIETPAGDLVGHAGCHWGWDTHCPSTWVVIAPGHQRCGFGTAAIDLLMSYLFENTPAHNVNGWVSSWNGDGLTFAKTLGFSETGRIPRSGLRDGVYFDDVMIDILKPEWRTRREGSDGA